MKRILLGLLLLNSAVSNAQNAYKLKSFLNDSTMLDHHVDSVFNTLSDKSKVAQLLMPAVGKWGMTEDTIKSLIRNQQIGGVLVLNGTMTQFKNWTNTFEKLNKEVGNLPFMYSADAEPSLVNRKMRGSTVVPKANMIKSQAEVSKVAKTISDDLHRVGINYNFSPVVDVASNKTVGYRGFGSNPANIIPFSQAFIDQTQSQNIVATAKHFPGHGLVSGDTHKSLQTINGELKELKYYPPLIENGVLSIMVAHIAVQNNKEFDTHGAPATTSKTIVTDLLRDSLEFKGLIVTDAMNMGGVVKVPNAAVKAISAGCDIVLMPLHPAQTHAKLLSAYRTDEEFKSKVDLASKRIIRMKICLGLIDIL